MKFSIGSQFSREFSFDESSITLTLTDELNGFFEDKFYGDRITMIYIAVICVSKKFEPFFKVRPIKLYRSEPSLEYGLKLVFDIFKAADEQERRRILLVKILEMTKLQLRSKTIKGFEKERFINDLEAFLEL